MDTKKLRQKILDLAIRGKLVPQDPNDEPASVLLERIKAEKEQLIKDGKIKRSKKSASSDTSPYENVPFEIPENWAWCKPSDVFIINHRNNAEDTIEVGFVPMPLIKDGYHYQHSYESVLWKTVKTGYTHFTNGDFGLAKITPCFENRKSVIFNNLPNGIGAGTTELHILRPIMIDVKYVSYFYSSEEFISYGIKNFSGAVGQQRISMEVIEDFGFALPPQKEQNRIIEAVEKWFSIIDQLEQEQTDLKNAIKRAKSKILDLAIHGKLVPQDPNDEPAIDLLRRINPSFKLCDNAHYKSALQGWCSISLNDCMVEILNGFAFQSGKYVENGIRVIRITNVQDGKIMDDDPKFYPKSSIKEIEKFILKKNDLLMSLTGNVGRVGFLPNELLPAALNQRVGCIRMNEQFIHKKYLFYYFQTDTFRNDCITSAKGVAQLNISTEWLKRYLINIPPYAEQKRIVAKIEELFATIDKIKESLEA